MKTKLIHALSQIVGSKRILREREKKAYASIDKSTNVQACEPLVVVRVHSVSELISVTRTCISFRNPLVVRAAGTGKSGGAVPGPSWAVIDTSALNKIISIDQEN